jgi:uroporphyrin-3 C-methyltransferase
VSDDFLPTDPASPVAPAPAAPAAAPRRRARLLPLLLGLGLLAAVGLAGWQWWSLQRSERAEAAARAEAGALERRLETMEAALQSQARLQKALETRAADNAATNKVLREELLGMGERASLLEDAVARLADNRLRGEVMLRLNEAEFLLLLGEERLRLFGDVPAAIQAYQLTDAALASLDDPVLVTLRQTLTQELLALRAVPTDPRPRLRAELARLGETLAALPASRAGTLEHGAASDSRLLRLLSQLVTVRRVDARDAVLGPVQRETTLAALRLQLELAQAALARPDPAAYAHALEQAGRLATRLFAAEEDAVVALHASLERLRGATLVPELPVLGATLQELRGLRATRSVGALERDPLPAAAPAVPEGGE